MLTQKCILLQSPSDFTNKESWPLDLLKQLCPKSNEGATALLGVSFSVDGTRDDR